MAAWTRATVASPNIGAARLRKVAAALIAAAILTTASPASAAGPRHGLASWYGPGAGVATQWCTWVRRHSVGCGSVRITSIDTGRVVVAPVVDWCQCFRGTSRERIVDLQWDVVAALGLDRADGIYPVTVERVLTSDSALPDTSMTR